MATGTPITYTVTAVTPDTRYGPTSTPIPGKKVVYSTSIGYEGTIFVPDSVFVDTVAVRRMIEAEVMSVAATMSVSGTITG